MVPDWLAPLVRALPGIRPEHLSRFRPPATGGRRSAVLALFGEGARGPEVLLIERAATLRAHAGQPAFPGGALDPEDDGPVSAALREAAEEVGLAPGSVEVLGTLPALWLPPSGFVVTPVVAYWRAPHEVSALDPAEVAAVHRVPIEELVDPAHRLVLVHPSGLLGPAFEIGELLVWGFTAGVLDRLLSVAGWERPWNRDRCRELDPERLALAARSSAALQGARETGAPPLRPPSPGGMP